MSETINDILTEMRTIDYGVVENDFVKFADRIEEAARNATMLCYQACSCELLAKMETENEKLRTLVKGLLLASSTECADCRYDCGPNRESCIVHEAAKYIDESEVEND